MTALLQVPLDDDSDEYVMVEVSADELAGLTDSGVVLASGDGSRFEAAGFSLASAMDGVMPALRVILARLRSGLQSPDEISIKLGLQIGGEAGIVFAKGTTTATVEVTVKWAHRHDAAVRTADGAAHAVDRPAQ